MNAHDAQLGGYLAIRGSVYRMRGQLGMAVRDHERMVELRAAQPTETSALGEALAELGWTYAWAGRLGKAKQHLSRGVALLCEQAVTSPMQAGFRIRALRKLGAVQALTIDFRGSRRSIAEARSLARQYLVPDQMRIA
jgi:lipopolysaccharide biosynthesis regulator YciM